MMIEEDDYDMDVSSDRHLRMPVLEGTVWVGGCQMPISIGRGGTRDLRSVHHFLAKA